MVFFLSSGYTSFNNSEYEILLSWPKLFLALMGDGDLWRNGLTGLIIWLCHASGELESSAF